MVVMFCEPDYDTTERMKMNDKLIQRQLQLQVQQSMGMKSLSLSLYLPTYLPIDLSFSLFWEGVDISFLHRVVYDKSPPTQYGSDLTPFLLKVAFGWLVGWSVGW
mmetsp:Transcript_9329/g.23470  ORF Transcript_9329/g.23470 Transcript_9329/m.23470 type:complete len:105 (+) Transcript_9329:205-519(+)